MKYTTPDNIFWIEPVEGGARVGLTPEAINNFGIFLVFEPHPVINSLVKKGELFVALESISQLGCLPCPLTGLLTWCNDPLIENPADITTEQCLFIFQIPITTKGPTTYAMLGL